MSTRDVDLTDGDLLKPLLVLSLPIVLSQLLQVGYNLADTFWVGRLGQEAVSALSYSWPLVFLPALGLARGTETMVGQNLGTQQAGRARTAVLYSSAIVAGVLAVVGVVAYAFAGPITSMFIADAPDVVALGAEYLRVIGPTFLFIGVFQVVQGAFRGSGSTRLAMAFAILSLWVFRLPLAYVFQEVLGMGASGVWLAIALSNVLSMVAAVAWFARGTWTSNVVAAEATGQVAGND